MSSNFSHQKMASSATERVYRRTDERPRDIVLHTARGNVYWCCFENTIGSEIAKCRPAIIVSANDHNCNRHCDLLIVVPVTTLPNGMSARSDEVVISPQETGLPERSVTVCNQLRSVDRIRIRQQIGHVQPVTMSAIDRCLLRVLALEPEFSAKSQPVLSRRYKS